MVELLSQPQLILTQLVSGLVCLIFKHSINNIGKGEINKNLFNFPHLKIAAKTQINTIEDLENFNENANFFKKIF